MCLCCIYFLVTAVQYWATAFAIKVMDINPKVANLIFSVCAISGPVLGIVLGGSIVD